MSQSTIATNSVIFRVALALPINRLFDYKVPEHIDLSTIKPGIRLLVPFGKRQAVAYLVTIDSQTDLAGVTLKTIDKIIDFTPLLKPHDMALLHWASRYYHHPLGEVINTAFPILLRKGNSAVLKQEKSFLLTNSGRNYDLQNLKCAPKQLALLEKFKSGDTVLSASQLSGCYKNWRQPLQQLINKKLVTPVAGNTDSVTDSLPVIRQQPIQANQQQQSAIATVCNSLHCFAVFLLEGVTGSGKTEVYLQIIHRVLEQGKQIIVLLPEITLTPQLQKRFQDRFAVPISIFHSSLSETERQNAWLNMQQGNSAILLGTRSALFTPLKRPGLIILDEEHDSSFKQQEGFRFSARDVAIVRARNLQIPILLGSATPSLESLYNVARGRYQLLHLAERAGNAKRPEMRLLDIRNKKMIEGLSMPLVAEIQKTLSRNEQVLIFLNRRGFAPSLICHACGWVARCRRCDANLVIHYHDNLLRCHHCAAYQPLPDHCPACRSEELTPLGLGTERVENALAELFTGEKVIRLDRDSTQRKGVLVEMLAEIKRGTTRIILGTQMLAKGHHFPNVTLVALLDVDSGLYSIDFHSPERLAQLIVQVAGRAGRADKPGKVILQTRQPDHPLLHAMINEDYRSFAKTALQERKQAKLPPFSHQALLRVTALDRQAPQEFLETIASLISSEHMGQTQVLGPVPSPMARKAGKYRYQMLFQNDKRRDLHQLLDWLIPKIEGLKQARKVRWSLDVDPVDLY